MAVLPVWRSPRINSRWPRPTGMSASMTLRPVWSGTVTGARSMMGGAGRSMGRRLLEATGPLPSSGRPSGSMTRPSNPSPTATSMTRPVRWTSSPACRCQYSPSRTTPISSASTLNAMPSTSPGNVTNSSKPTPGRPDTLAMPVATLVIVPTSRGVSCGVKASRTWLIPANALSKTFWRLSGSMFIGSLFRASDRLAGLGSVLASGLGSLLPISIRLRSVRFGLASGLSFSFRSSSTPFSSDAR